MKLYKVKTIIAVIIIMTFNFSFSFAQTKNVDLVSLLKEGKISAEKVTVDPIQNNKDYNGLELKGPGREVAWITGTDFATGEIELDMKSVNFVGLAFHISNSTTYESIYFRPFNFKAADSVKRSHAVQYHSLPDYSWQKLRTQFPDQYEDVINPVPEPDQWFHVRVVVSKDKISAYVNGSKTPCLAVNKLGSLTNGMLGFFIGTGTGGYFANLKVMETK
jgi:hypothetical protein